jgi:hypothetical protein
MVYIMFYLHVDLLSCCSGFILHYCAQPQRALCMWPVPAAVVVIFNFPTFRFVRILHDQQHMQNAHAKSTPVTPPCFACFGFWGLLKLVRSVALSWQPQSVLCWYMTSQMQNKQYRTQADGRFCISLPLLWAFAKLRNATIRFVMSKHRFYVQ